MTSKVTAHVFLASEGSDDPRAIEGGGGYSERHQATFTNSRWLIEAYERAYYNRYGDRLIIRYSRAA